MYLIRPNRAVALVHHAPAAIKNRAIFLHPMRRYQRSPIRRLRRAPDAAAPGGCHRRPHSRSALQSPTAFVHHLGLALRVKVLRDLAQDADDLALQRLQPRRKLFDEIQDVFVQLLRKAVVLLRRILLAGAGGQRAPQPAYLLPGARACSNPVWKLLKYLAGMGCNARGAAIDPASLNLKYPFGLSLSKPCAALRQAQRERFKQIRAGSITARAIGKRRNATDRPTRHLPEGSE